MLFLNQQAPLNKTMVIDDKRMEEHNQNFPWSQGANKFFEGATLADAKKIINTSFASHSNLVRCSVDDSVTIPESFDSRVQWPNCVLPVGNQQKNLRSFLCICCYPNSSRKTMYRKQSTKISYSFSSRIIIM